jgi:hypothetical protein
MHRNRELQVFFIIIPATGTSNSNNNNNKLLSVHCTSIHSTLHRFIEHRTTTVLYIIIYYQQHTHTHTHTHIHDEIMATHRTGSDNNDDDFCVSLKNIFKHCLQLALKSATPKE